MGGFQFDLTSLIRQDRKWGVGCKFMSFPILRAGFPVFPVDEMKGKYKGNHQISIPTEKIRA